MNTLFQIAGENEYEEKGASVISQSRAKKSIYKSPSARAL